MQSSVILAAVSTAAVLALGCGSGSSTPAAPSTPSAVTVSIVGIQGNRSYVPDPVSTNGNQVMFKNNDPVNTHHIVMDDGSADFGSLSPGATSPSKAVTGNFHCANHPSMVGSINGAAAPTPPPGSGNGY